MTVRWLDKSVLAPVIGMCLVLGALFVAFQLTREDGETRDAALARLADSDAERRRLFAARDPAVTRPEITSEPCPVEVRPPAPLPEGRVIAEAETSDDLAAQLHRYLEQNGYPADILPLDPRGAGPLGAPRGWESDHARIASEHPLVLLVERWDDPRVHTGLLPGSFQRGRLTGTLVVWSASERRVVCAAEVDAQSSEELTLVTDRVLGEEREDHPLARARVDLVVQALRDGVARVRRTAR